MSQLDYQSALNDYNRAMDEYTRFSSNRAGANDGILRYLRSQITSPSQLSGLPRTSGGGFTDYQINESKSALDAARARLQALQGQRQATLGNQMDRYTNNARNALYQGLTSYNPQPLLSPSGNQFDAPQGNLSMYQNRIRSLLGG